MQNIRTSLVCFSACLFQNMQMVVDVEKLIVAFFVLSNFKSFKCCLLENDDQSASLFLLCHRLWYFGFLWDHIIVNIAGVADFDTLFCLLLCNVIV